MKEDVIDCHTHAVGSCDGIISVSPDFSAFEPDKVYSVGIHPWSTSDDREINFQELEKAASAEQVVAIGECGLDRLRGASLDIQIGVFEKHIELSEHIGKPLIIHCVRYSSELLALRCKYSPAQPWIYHGFRGKPELARKLADSGIYLSFGEKYNEDSLMTVPDDRLLLETDDSHLTVRQIMELYPAEKAACASENLRRLLRNNY